MKRTFIIFSLVLLLVLCFPTVSFAANYTPADGETFDLAGMASGDTVSIGAGTYVTMLSSTPATPITNIQIVCEPGSSVYLLNAIIDNSGTPGVCPIVFTGTGNTLKLGNGVTLTGGADAPGIQLEGSSELDITTNAVTDACTVTGGPGAAGIGGRTGQNGGTVSYNGGNLTVTGGGGGAGIGGGSGADGGNVTISGGTVTASSDSGGYDIGGGLGGAGGTLGVDGMATLTLAGSGTNAAFTPGTCRITGAGVASLSGFYIDGIKFPSDRVIDLSAASSGTGYTYSAPTFTINADGEYLIWNATTSNRIVVSPGVNAHIILFGASIQLTSGCAFNMTGATVDITLMSSSTLKSGTGYTGLLCPLGATLTISGGGSVDATGGGASTGVSGSGIGGNAATACGSITINSGTVTAKGGTRKGATFAPGIGGCVIAISGGNVTATSGIGGAPAIGYSSNAGSSVTIKGGTVTAASAPGGYGIGGKGSDLTNITISGGSVTATSSLATTVLGGNGGTVNISGGTVFANNTGGGQGIAVYSGAVNISGGTVFAGCSYPAQSHDIGGPALYEGTLNISGAAKVFLRNNNCITPVTTTHANETFPAGTAKVYGEAIPVQDTWTGGFGAWLHPCTLSYNVNGGSGTLPPDMIRLYGVTTDLSDGGGLSREGCTFSGWNTAADGSGTSYAAGDAFEFRANTTVYAQWTQLELSSSVSGGKIYTGGRITLTPSILGGQWSYDTQYLSLSGNTFTALKAGSTAVAYTVGGVTVSYNIVVAAAPLPDTGQDHISIYTGGRITLTPDVPGGQWSYDPQYLSLSGNTFTALKSGSTTVTYTVGGVTVRYDIIVTAASLPETGQDYIWVFVLAGLAAAALFAMLLTAGCRRRRDCR